MKTNKAKPTIFEFESYSFKPSGKRLYFRYKVHFTNKKPIAFTETIVLPRTLRFNKIPRKLLKNLLDGIHLILGISYYKAYCPSKVKLNHISLSESQAFFWNTVYRKGLGEFCYRNKINPRRVAAFPFKNCNPKADRLPLNDKVLVGIGGGKDSIVVTQLLKEHKHDVTGFVVESKSSPVIGRTIKKLRIEPLKIHRILDEKIFSPHLYNGHIPVSAVYAFLSVLAGVLYGYSYIAMGNEQSSNWRL